MRAESVFRVPVCPDRPIGSRSNKMLPGLVWHDGQSILKGNAGRVGHHRKHGVVANNENRFDNLGFREFTRQGAVYLVRDLLLCMELVARTQKKLIPR